MHYVRWFFYLLSVILFGCAAQGSGTSSEPTPLPKPAYHIDDCGSFVGWKALSSTHCNGTDITTAAECDIDGGAVETSFPPDEHSWECATTWNDSAKGGSICIHLTCEPAPDAGHE